jgi:hypothetical protein
VGLVDSRVPLAYQATFNTPYYQLFKEFYILFPLPVRLWLKSNQRLFIPYFVMVLGNFIFEGYAALFLTSFYEKILIYSWMAQSEWLPAAPI